MSFVDGGKPRLRALVVTGGHPFDAPAFFDVFDSNRDVEWEHTSHPQASERLCNVAPGEFDALVFYDMPGVGLRRGDTPEPSPPPPALEESLTSLFDLGQGAVFLHHAIASWPAWEEYAHWVGGRFFYQSGRLDGATWPDSGYAFDVAQHLVGVAAGHPVLEGLEDGFDITDECYLAAVLEDEVVPLLRSDARFECDRFFSAAAAVAGRLNSRDGWTHPPGSNLVVWAKRARRSPVVYVQPGDGPSAYANPSWRRLVANALRWVASPQARQWAQTGPGA